MKDTGARACGAPHPGEKCGQVTAIALYFHHLDKAGGAERMICQLANALDRRGLDVHLLSLDAPGAASFYSFGHSITWHRLGATADVRGKAQRTRAMAAIMRRHRIRLLIGFVMSGDKTVYAASVLASVKLVAAERNGPSMYGLRFGAVQRWQCFGLLHLCDAIVVQFSDFIQGYPKSLRRRMACIPNPVAPSPARASPGSPRSDGRFQLLAVSRLDQFQKRLDQLLRAFAMIADEAPQWDLRIIGEGPHERELREMIADLGLSDRASIEAPTQRIKEVYADAGLFVIPSSFEGFPNALAEALAAGLPAVGFGGADGVSQLIRAGETGWLAGPGNDSATLAETLAEAMSDDTERSRRGAMAARHMSEFAPDVQYGLWVSLIQRLVGAR